MAISKKKSWLKYMLAVIVVLFLGILACIVIFSLPSWPSKAQLCRDVEAYIPKDQCLKLNDRFLIIEQAFPAYSTSSDDVKNALGDYLHDEYPTVNGHVEIYYLSVHPINYLVGFPSEFIFTYNQDGILRRIGYQD
jgi:hypothetical protein